MFMANDRDKLRHEMKLQGLEEVRFKFDFEGTNQVWGPGHLDNSLSL